MSNEGKILLTVLSDLRKENTESHSEINKHLANLNCQVLKNQIAIEENRKDIHQLKTIKKWLLKNLWWLCIFIILGLLGSGGAIWQFIEGWVKRGMPG